MILAFVKMNVLPGKRKELWQTICSIVTEIKQENGCVDSAFYQNTEDENDFLLVEKWETRKALDEHLHSIRFTVLMGTSSLLSQPPEIMIHTVSHSSGIEPGVTSE